MANPVLTAQLELLIAGRDIGREGAAAALEEIMAGRAEDAQIAGVLVALRGKGETAEELAGLAQVVRARAEAVHVDLPALVDTCGTGGGPATVNISTGAAFVAAGAGATVAKHGNRAVTSGCGSADVLEALGARVDLAPDAVAECLVQTGVGFMFAPGHHPAFRHVAPVRRALGVRTAFNVLGPLANPAGAGRQLIGVFDPAYLERVAGALRELGTERAMIVAGRDGLDELSTRVPSDVVVLDDGEVTTSVVDPAALGLAAPADGALDGGAPVHNAAQLRAAIEGRPGPVRDVLCLNAAAALWVAGIAASLEDGLDLAEASVTGGAAADRLEAFVGATTRLAPALA